jgi:hypothetical protein
VPVKEEKDQGLQPLRDGLPRAKYIPQGLQRNQSSYNPNPRQLSGFFLKKKPPFTNDREATLTLVPL